MRRIILIFLALLIAVPCSASYFKQLQDQYGFINENTPMGEFRSVSPSRLVGATFIGDFIDPNFWNTALVNGATATQSVCQVILQTNATANGSAVMQSVRKAKYTGGQANRFRAQLRLSDAGKTNNIRRWGCWDGNDGAFFELNGTTSNVCVVKNGATQTVVSTSWNADTTIPTYTNVTSYEIYYTNGKVYFVVGDVLKHTYSATSDTWSSTTNLPITLQNVNTNGATTKTELQCRVATIYRLGDLKTSTNFGRITAAGFSIFKYNAGMLDFITLNNPTGSLITIQDANGVATGRTIAIINTPAQANPVTLHYGVPFEYGLAVTSTGTWDATIVYE